MADRKAFQIVAVAVAVLLTLSVVLWFVYIGAAGGNTDETIAFTQGGAVFFEAGLDYIKGFESVKFETVIRSSVLKPAKVEYTGVRLLDLLSDMNVDMNGKKSIIVKGGDGYMTGVSFDELNKKDIYIAYEMDGKPLKPREKNGYGPYQLVIPGDPYSQRWCKYIYEVEVE